MEVRSVEAIMRALNTAEVQYLIVGGLAVNAHGYVRLTRAVDIVLQLDPANVSRALSALFHVGYHVDPGETGRLCESRNARGLASQQRNDHLKTLE